MATSVSSLIVAAAQAMGLDPSLPLAIATDESNMNPNVSDGAAGEIGVFQILPSTAPGVNLRDLNTNIQTGVSLLAQYVAYFGDETAAIAAYNCGQQCVINAQAKGGSAWLSYVPSSTQGYVQRVIAFMQSFGATINVGSIFAPSGTLSTDSSVWTQIAIMVFILIGVSIFIDEM